MRVAITGATGFLGWHLSCRLGATPGMEVVRLGRREFADDALLAKALIGADAVIHVAGVNRADSDAAVEEGNVTLASHLVEALGGRPVHLVYANSTQADLDSPYGRGKSRASDILAAASGTLANVYLPNIFGEHGRPAYNSFVATFCHEIAAGRQPSVHVDNEVTLLHAQGAAEVLIAAAERRENHAVRPAGEIRRVSTVLAMLNGFHVLYAQCGEIPDISNAFARDLFNTYRSYLFPSAYPIYPQVHADDRGFLVETSRSHGGTGQSFASTILPGATRGDHYHLQKIERFMVVRGEAEISVRRLHDREVVRFRVNGDSPGFVDMPTLWTHKIRNVGEGEVVAVFWADQLLDPENPDQYPLQVEATA